MMNKGLGFLDNFHCEKTSFITGGAIALLFILGLLWIIGIDLLSIMIFEINDISITVLISLISIGIGGYLGVIYYRIRNGKTPIIVLKFWDVDD